MIIALGTTSKQKVGYVKKVLRRLGVSAELKLVQTSSGVAEQPLTSTETKRGAINRAKRALKLIPNADFGLGVEVGYASLTGGGYEMFCWVALVNKQKQVLQQSYSFALPDFHVAILKSGRYLGDHVKKYHAGTKNVFKHRVGEIIRNREPFITNALENGLLSFLNS